MHDELSPGDVRLTGFEAQLAALLPGSRLDRDRLMYAAGQRAGQARSRRTRGLLASGNVLLAAALVALWIVPQRSGKSIATPQAQRTAIHGSLVSAKAAPRAADDVHEPSLALVEGPTNLRLMQLFAEDPSAEWPGDRDSAASPSAGGDASSPSSSRRMLLQYLQGKSDQM